MIKNLWQILLGGQSNFNPNEIFKVTYSFAVVILIIIFLKKMIETYFAWHSGDSDSSPFTIILGFVKSLVIMLCFGYMYDLFVQIFADLNSKIIFATANNQDIVQILNKNLSINIFQSVCVLILVILLLTIIFQLINRGIELLILRIGIPFACIGLLNSDGGAFPSYVKKFLQNAFSVIVQLSLVNLSILLLIDGHLIYAICAMLMAVRSPHMLQDILIVSSGLGIGSSVGRTMERTASNGISKALGNKTMAKPK